MRLKYLLIFVLPIGFLSSCKSKMTAVKTTPKKVIIKVVEKDTENNTEREITESDLEIKSVIFNSTEEYIEFFKDAAIEEMKLYNIPASITLAQGILESSSGNSLLTKTSNNHFGIKCHTGWDGDRIFHDDDEESECFRGYKDPRESYRDHSLFLAFRTRYSKLFKLERGDYVGWAHGLRQAGYATDKRYPAKLISLIERYELDQYDSGIAGESKKRINKFNNGKALATHSIVKGETLFSISQRYGLSVDELKKINQLESNEISIGQILDVTKDFKEDTIEVSQNYTNLGSYKVLKGETLYAISRKFGLTVKEIKKINQLQSDNLSVGQVLKVKTLNEVSEVVPSKAEIKLSSYKVQKGETLYAISKKVGLTVEELRKINQLNTNNIYIGQVLKVKETAKLTNAEVPSQEVDLSSYEVSNGDTLSSISRRFGMTVDEIKLLNGLTSNIIFIGKELNLRGNIEKSEPVNPNRKLNLNYHQVASGETLYSISKQFGLTVVELKKINQLSSNNIAIGQVLVVSK